MASTSTILKRTAAAQAWALLISNATGDQPIIRPAKDGIVIEWKPGQADKFRKYLETSMSKPSSPDDLNVTIDMKPVLLPLAVKKLSLYVLGYTTLIIIGTKILWKKRR